MTPGQLSMLVKVLNLTTSPNDAEALAAARKANDLLKRGSTSWEQLLGNGGATTPMFDEDDGSLGGRDDAEARAIDAAFEEVFKLGDLRGSFEDFMDSIYQQWKEKHSLSPKQRAALFRAAENARERR